MKLQENITSSCNSLLIYFVVENTSDIEGSCVDLYSVQTCSGAEKTPSFQFCLSASSLLRPLRRQWRKLFHHASPLQGQCSQQRIQKANSVTQARKLFTEAWSLHLLASNDQTRNFKLRVTEWEGWVSYKQRVISDHRDSPFKSRSAVTSSDISSFPHQNASSVPYLPAFCLPPLSSSLHFRNPFYVGPVWFCGSE